MIDKCTISVIIPTFNAQQYIERCLNAVKKQTFHDFEIIVIDDCSSDQTAAYIEKFITENPQISCQLIENSCNHGDTYSRNVGIRAAKGTYLCTIDADDLLHPEFLMLLYNKAEETDAQFVFCGYDRCIQDKIIPYVPTWIYPDYNSIFKLKFAFLTTKTHICHCTVLYNRDFLLHNDLFYTESCRFTGDTEFVTKVLFNNPRFACVPKSLYYYLIHENSISTSTPSKSNFDGYYAYERVKVYLKNPLWKLIFLATRESREVFHIIESFYSRNMDLPFLFCSKYKIITLLVINALRKYKKDKDAIKILKQFYRRYFKKVKR